MKLGGSLISAAAHAAALAVVVLFVKVKGPVADTMIEMFSAPAAPVETAPESSAAPKSEGVGAAAAKPLAAVAPAQQAAKPAGDTRELGQGGPMNLSLTLDGDDPGGTGNAVEYAAAGNGAAVGATGGGGRAGGPIGSATQAPADMQVAPPCPGGTTRPVPIARVDFAYPANVAPVAGSLQARVSVTPEGAVSGVQVLTPLGAAIDQAAISNLLRWRFRPATKCGTAFASDFVVSIKLELGD